MQEKIYKHYNVLGYRIEWHFHHYTLAIAIGEHGHSDRNINSETKKTIEQKLDYKFIRIDPAKEDFILFRDVNELFRHIKQSNKKL